jgi:hypothetical protein
LFRPPAEEVAGPNDPRTHALFRRDLQASLHLDAIRAGFGIGACQVGLAARDGNLVRMLPRAVELAFDTSVTMHETLRASRNCRVVFDALVAGLQAYVREQ